MRCLILVVVLGLLAWGLAYAGMPAWQWMNGPYVGRAVDITIGSGGGQKILYAADEYASLFRSTDEGANWLSDWPPLNWTKKGLWKLRIGT